MPRRKKIAALCGALAAFSVGAIAFVLLTATFEGSHTGHATTSSELKEPLTVSFGATLVPGSSEPITVSFTPKEKLWILKGDKSTQTITSSNEATCPATWFTVAAETGSLASWFIKGGEPEEGYKEILSEAGKVKEIAGFTLSEKNEAVEQSGCSAAELTVTISIHGPVKYN